MTARPIMIQGTASGAGKSLIAAALCRIFTQDGLRTAPFKSQNMALNSFITDQGLEMGRAQVMQAQAAGVRPDVRMNPILLKPTGEMGSQVIVMGSPVGNMAAADYFRYKERLVPTILESYRSLAGEYDAIVLEGAGSPAEINLREGDIVNMGMARMVSSPVLLVADIDRGGVFASLAGTMLLLKPEERRRVRGFIINKFRGDLEILRPGLRMIEEITGVPVVGVLPCMEIDLDDEDSLSPRFNRRMEGEVNLGVVRLPRISNFTDFAVFEQIPGTVVHYVDSPCRLGGMDLIFLPGSKNTMEDLRWLRQSGMEAAVCRMAAGGTPVFGICGGFQMLGESVSDPQNAESGGQMRGMGLLPVETVFSMEKKRAQVSGAFREMEGPFSCLAGLPLEGYEIHMGRSFPVFSSEPGGETVEITLQSGAASHRDGWCRANVAGSYVHGLFDQGEAALALVKMLRKRKGLSEDGLEPLSPEDYRREQFDRLAAQARESLDLDQIYDILWNWREDGP